MVNGARGRPRTVATCAALTALVVFVLAGFTGCRDDAARREVRASTTGGNVTRSSTSTTSTGPGGTPDPSGTPTLAAAVPDRQPEGFTPAVAEEGLIGAVDLQDVSDAVGPELASTFRKAGFTGGYGRSWSRGAGSTLEIHNVVAYEFGDPPSDVTAAAAGPQFGPGIDIAPLGADGTASFSFTRTYDGVPRPVAARMFTDGTRLYVVWVVAGSAPAAAAAADDLTAAAHAAAGA